MENKPRLINAEMKDRLLKRLCEYDVGILAQVPKIKKEVKTILPKQPKGVPLVVSSKNEEAKSSTDSDIKENERRAIYKTFEKDGLIEHLDEYPTFYQMVVNEAAHDFLSEGGYTLQNEVFRASIQKLFIELKELEHSASVPEQTKKMLKNALDVISKVAPFLGLII